MIIGILQVKEQPPAPERANGDVGGDGNVTGTDVSFSH